MGVPWGTMFTIAGGIVLGLLAVGLAGRMIG